MKQTGKRDSLPLNLNYNFSRSLIRKCNSHKFTNVTIPTDANISLAVDTRFSPSPDQQTGWCPRYHHKSRLLPSPYYLALAYLTWSPQCQGGNGCRSGHCYQISSSHRNFAELKYMIIARYPSNSPKGNNEEMINSIKTQNEPPQTACPTWRAAITTTNCRNIFSYSCSPQYNPIGFLLLSTQNPRIRDHLSDGLEISASQFVEIPTRKMLFSSIFIYFRVKRRTGNLVKIQRGTARCKLKSLRTH